MQLLEHHIWIITDQQITGSNILRNTEIQNCPGSTQSHLVPSIKHLKHNKSTNLKSRHQMLDFVPKQRQIQVVEVFWLVSCEHLSRNWTCDKHISYVQNKHVVDFSPVSAQRDPGLRLRPSAEHRTCCGQIEVSSGLFVLLWCQRWGRGADLHQVLVLLMEVLCIFNMMRRRLSVQRRC